MGIAFRSIASAFDHSAVNTIIVNVPSGVQDGDALLAFISVGTTNDSDLPAPAGWALVVKGKPSTAPSDDSDWVFSRVASSEPANYAFPWTGTALHVCGAIVAYQYTDSSTAVDASAEDSTQDSASTAASSPAVTPTSIRTLVVRLVGCTGQANPTDLPITPPAGSAERLELECGSGAADDVTIGIADMPVTDLTEIAAVTFTLQEDNINWGAAVVLKPGKGLQAQPIGMI